MTISKHINNNVNGFQIIDEQGNEYFLNEATEELAIAKYNTIKLREANPPAPTYSELRRKEYPAPEEMIVALWESVVEGRNESRDILQTKRLEIKAKYPKSGK